MEKLTDDRLCEAIETDTYVEVENLKEIKKQPSVQELYLELNKYEKLNTKLGCPLDILIKAKEGFFTKWGFISKEHIFYIDLLSETIEFEFIDSSGNYNEEGQVYIKDHKKTWWIKEDKSE